MRRVREPRASPRNPRGATWEGKDAWARVVPSPWAPASCDELLLQPDGCWAAGCYVVLGFLKCTKPSRSPARGAGAEDGRRSGDRRGMTLILLGLGGI